MGATIVFRLPHLTSQHFAPTYQRLQAQHGARVTSRWSVEVRAFVQTPLHDDSPFVRADALEQGLSAAAAPRPGAAQGSAANSNAAAASAGARMWHLTTSELPGKVFVYIEAPEPEAAPAPAAAGSSAEAGEPAADGAAAKHHSRRVRRTLFVASASFALLLAKANLPRPLGGADGGAAGGSGGTGAGVGASSGSARSAGAPGAGGGSGSAGGRERDAGGLGLAGAASLQAGPGAWVARGSPLSVEGVVLELPDRPAGAYAGGLGFAPEDLPPVVQGLAAESAQNERRASAQLNGSAHAHLHLNGNGAAPPAADASGAHTPALAAGLPAQVAQVGAPAARRALPPAEQGEWRLRLGQLSVGARSAGGMGQLEYLPSAGLAASAPAPSQAPADGAHDAQAQPLPFDEALPRVLATALFAGAAGAGGGAAPGAAQSQMPELFMLPPPSAAVAAELRFAGAGHDAEEHEGDEDVQEDDEEDDERAREARAADGLRRTAYIFLELLRSEGRI